VIFLGGHGPRVERSHGASARKANGILVGVFLITGGLVIHRIGQNLRRDFLKPSLVPGERDEDFDYEDNNSEEIAAEVLANAVDVSFLGGHGPRVERSHGASARTGERDEDFDYEDNNSHIAALRQKLDLLHDEQSLSLETA
jgi:hypothetical protein